MFSICITGFLEFLKIATFTVRLHSGEQFISWTIKFRRRTSMPSKIKTAVMTKPAIF